MKILDEALALSDEDRAALAEALNASLDGVAIELSAEWESEIARRVGKIKSGEAVFHDAREHLEKLQAKYGG